jgi:hypothetical protein
MKEHATFRYSGQDSLSQFMVWIVLFSELPFYVWRFAGRTAAALAVLMTLVVIMGLRASIVATSSQVVITKSWFFIPYWRYTGRVIEGVWFGGDWGEPEGASGVVVKLDGKKVHVGSRKTMHYLYTSLFPMREWR